MIPDLAPGYRYDQAAVNEAAEVIVRGTGEPDYWTDDPRNVVQDVVDIFTDHGGLVAMDLGYEATIIDLRAKLAREFERGYRQGREVALAEMMGSVSKIDKFIAQAGLGGDRQGRRPMPNCGLSGCPWCP